MEGLFGRLATALVSFELSELHPPSEADDHVWLDWANGVVVEIGTSDPSGFTCDWSVTRDSDD
jgi:hypothetical protein